MQSDVVGRRLKMQHLKIVMAVAEWGSMQQAARHLAISQPVVSKIIADLEDMLGVRLFDRSPQGVEPTGAPCSSAPLPSSTNCGRASTRSGSWPIRRLESCASAAPSRCLPDLAWR
jgi:hypothetical protein